MGEFLLSILGYNADGKIIFTRAVKYAKYKVGELVPIYYPHKSRSRGVGKCKPYYRILKKAIDPELLHKLLDSGDPDAYDMLGFVSYQRELQDAEIAKSIGEGTDMHDLARQMKWIPQAIEMAVNRNRLRVLKRKQAVEEQTKAYKPEKSNAPKQVFTPEYVQSLWKDY